MEKTIIIITLGPGPVPDRIRRAEIKFGSLRLLVAFVLIDEFLGSWMLFANVSNQHHNAIVTCITLTQVSSESSESLHRFCQDHQVGDIRCPCGTVLVT